MPGSTPKKLTLDIRYLQKCRGKEYSQEVKKKTRKPIGCQYLDFYLNKWFAFPQMREVMEISEIKSRIEGAINALTPQKLKIALEFLEDLQRSDEEETRILLNDPGFMEDYRAAKEDIRTGKTISWEDIKRNV
jgi:hypothetical protein